MTHAADEPHDGRGEQFPEKAARTKKSRGPAFKVFRVVLLLLLIPVLLVGGYLARGWFAIDSIDRDSQLTPAEYENRPTPGKAESADVAAPVNFVLLGSDSRGEDRGRSDSLMVAHISGDRKNVYLISFPRDMWVDIPEHGKAKINAAYAYGGAPLTVRTLESLLNVRMDHTAIIDFEGFTNLTTAVGGVTVNNPWETKDPVSGGYFKKGEITVEGEQALRYVRQRKELPNGDLDRAYRQRTVVKAIVKKLATPEVLANPVRFNDVVGKVADTLTVDDQITNQYITELAGSMRLTGGESIKMMQAPITGFASIDGQSVDVVDFQLLELLAKAMQTDTVADFYAAHGKDNYSELPEVEPGG